MRYDWADQWGDWAEPHKDPSMKSLKERCDMMVADGGKGKGKASKLEQGIRQRMGASPVLLAIVIRAANA